MRKTGWEALIYKGSGRSRRKEEGKIIVKMVEKSHFHHIIIYEPKIPYNTYKFVNIYVV